MHCFLHHKDFKPLAQEAVPSTLYYPIFSISKTLLFDYCLTESYLFLFCIITPSAPPTPYEVTALVTNVSTVTVTWQWTSLGSAPDCFNTTSVTYYPKGGSELSLQLSDPVATEGTLIDLQCNTNYTITVVATAGEHRREGVAEFPLILEGTVLDVIIHVCK